MRDDTKNGCEGPQGALRDDTKNGCEEDYCGNDLQKNRLLLLFYKTYLEFVPTVLFFLSRVTARH